MSSQKERFIVSHGRRDSVREYRDPEDGFMRTEVTYYYGVSFTTGYGIEYTHRHLFDDTTAGRVAATRLARRVEAALNARGLAGIDEDKWATRTMYGTQAYLDEEPAIVAREKADALESEFYQR